MKLLALLAIRFYQHFLSPLKGFGCAYRVHTGRAGCSGLGYRAIRRFGVWHGASVLRRRLSLCGVAHRRFNPPARRLHRQSGVCDLACDVPCDLPCDMPDLCSGSNLAEFISCCDCGSCDWPSRRTRKDREQEANIYLPPHRRTMQP